MDMVRGGRARNALVVKAAGRSEIGENRGRQAV
jgi:hypothetical protein